MSGRSAQPVRILHCLPADASETACLRVCGLITALGNNALHHVVFAASPPTDAGTGMVVRAGAHIIEDFPAIAGSFGPRRMARLAQEVANFDLVLTHGWETIDIAMAHTLLRDRMVLPPLVHHESDDSWDAAGEGSFRRRWYRRFALGRVDRIVVSSAHLEKVALVDWQQPRSRLKRIPLGIDTARFDHPARHDALRVMKRDGELWLGTTAGLDRATDWARLLESFSNLPSQWQLIIVGDGSARDRILSAAMELEVSHRVHLPGAVREIAEALALFDIFVVPGRQSQNLVRIAEAMAAGLPIVGLLEGGIAEMPGDANRALIETAALGGQLEQLSADELQRRKIGAGNRDKARSLFDRSRLEESYRQLVGELTGIVV